MSDKIFRPLALPLLVLALLAPASPARADDEDPEVVAQAKEHYKAGLEAYKAAKYDVAIRELKKAYLLKRLPPLLLNIGATYRKMGDLDLALHFYQKFLDEAPSDAKDRPEVEKIIGEIKQEKATGSATPDEGPSPRRGDGDEGPKRGGGEWNHAVIDAVPPGMPIDVRVSTPVMKGVKVFVYYRGPGQAEFNALLMKRRGREKVARVPADAVSGRSLQYYIEAKDSAGTVVKSSGSQANPNIIMVEEGVKPVMIASMSRRGEEPEQPDEEEQPKRSRKPTRDLDEEEAPTTGNVGDDEPVRTVKPKKHGSLSTLQLAGIGLLAGGGGLAIIGGTMLGLAKHEADIVSGDSALGTFMGAPVFFNGDSTVGTQDADHEKRGKIYNIVGILGTAVGGAAIAAGAGCMIADAVGKADRAHPKKKHKKKRRVVEDDEEEEVSWSISPNVGPGIVAVTGAVRF